MIDLASSQEPDPFQRLCQLLRLVDEEHPGESGIVSFGDGRDDVIHVQGGRVCWAVSSSMTTRLIHRLAVSDETSERELRLLFHECRQSGKPFGQTLLERGMVTFDVLRGALRQHTAEALAGLALRPSAPRWTPSRVDGYDATLTFSTAELLAHAGDEWWGPLAVAVRAELDDALRGRSVIGLAFLPLPEVADAVIPVGNHGADAMRVHEILDIGAWAAALLRASGRIAGRLISVTRDDGRTSLVWTSQGARYVTIAREPAEMAFVIAHLSRRAPAD